MFSSTEDLCVLLIQNTGDDRKTNALIGNIEQFNSDKQDFSDYSERMEQFISNSLSITV